MNSRKTLDPYDPRSEDMKEDSKLWEKLLERFWYLKKELYHTFFVLRGGGSTLKLVCSKLIFTFGDDLSEEVRDIAKAKYLAPNQAIIEVTINKLASELSNQNPVDLEKIPF